MFRFVFYTWLVANLLHPFFMLGISYLGTGGDLSGADTWATAVSMVVMFLFISFFVTLPALAGGYLVLKCLKSMKADVIPKFCFWLLSIPFTIIINLLIIALLIGGTFPFYIDKKLLELMVPSVIATITASLIYYKLFRSAFLKLDQAVIENNLIESSNNIQS